MKRRALLLAPAVLAAVLAGGAAAGASATVLTTLCLALLAGLVVLGIAAAADYARRGHAEAKRAAVAAGAVRERSTELATKKGLESVAKRSSSQLRTLAEHDTAQVESMVQLVALLRPEWPLPRLRGWAASPDALLALSTIVREQQPALVVDLGSGSSTIVTALTMRRFGIAGRVVGVDHDAVYAEQTRVALRRHGLDDIAEVRTAPLQPLEIEGHQGDWYDPATFDDLHGIGVVFVDGPPGVGGPSARFPALPVLRDRLLPGAVLLLDDADRPDEREIVASWEQTLGVSHEWLWLEKGGAVLRLPGRASEPGPERG